MRRLTAFFLVALLSACSDDPTPAPSAAGTDTGPQADTSQSGDTTAPPVDSHTTDTKVTPPDSRLADSAPSDTTPTRDTSAPPDTRPSTDTSPSADTAPDEDTSAPGDITDPPPPIPPEAAIDSGYWAGAAQPMATSPYGNVAAISCHNCFSTGAGSNSDNLNATLGLLHAAQEAGADLLEIDVKEEDGEIYVDDYDDGGTKGALFSAVLADPAVLEGYQPLFIELREDEPTLEFIGQLLDQLLDHDYGHAWRPVFLRAARSRRQNLLLAQALLATAPYADLVDSVRLHELMGKEADAEPDAVQDHITNAQGDGFHGVEFDHQSPDLFGRLTWAKNLGLATGVYAIPALHADALVASWRNEVDVITVDTVIAKARAAVEEDNGLLYLNTWSQDGYGEGVRYLRNNQDVHLTPIEGEGLPSLSLFAPGEDLFGSVLNFVATNDQSLRLGPVVGDNGGGFLVTATVNFDQLDATDTRMIIANSDSAGFYLQVADEFLHWGVHVDGSYRTATYPLSAVNGEDSYYIVGAYDGDGGVRLWINGSDSGVVFDTAVGMVTPSSSPVLVGADPEGSTDSRYHFDGKIQQVQVLKWNHHDCEQDSDCDALNSVCDVGICDALTGFCSTSENTPATGFCVDAEELEVVVRTDHTSNAGTDDGVQICLSQTWCRPLDNGEIDDNEQGQVDHHRYRLGPGRQWISGITLSNLPGTGSDAWKPACVALVADGELLYCNDTLPPLQIGTDANDSASWTDDDPTQKTCEGCFATALTHGPMVGHTTETTSLIWLRTAYALPVQVRYSASMDFTDSQLSETVHTRMHEGFVTEVPLTDLPPGSTIYYEVLVDGIVASGSPLSFRTAPTGPGQFTMAFGSCMKFAHSSTMPVFDAMLAESPDILLMLGDNHYANTTDSARLDFFYQRVRSVPSYANILANTVVHATWDDHDYTGNNDDEDTPAKIFSLASFEKFWSNNGAGTVDAAGVWSRFSWGDVDIFLLDDRYYRDTGTDTLLGQAQLDWILSELLSSDATFKVVASGSQWTPGGSSDSWAVFPQEREYIFNFIMAQEIPGVFLISGDIHRTEVRRLRDKTTASYELWEFTSSPLANGSSGCSNGNSPDTVVFCQSGQKYFSLLHFSTDAAIPSIVHEIRNEDGDLLHTQVVTLDQLTL